MLFAHVNKPSILELLTAIPFTVTKRTYEARRNTRTQKSSKEQNAGQHEELQRQNSSQRCASDTLRACRFAHKFAANRDGCEHLSPPDAKKDALLAHGSR